LDGLVLNMDFGDWAGQALLMLGLIIVCSIGPGLFFVRWFRWPALETLCASAAASALFVGLGSAVIYWLNLQPVGAMHWGLSGICLGLNLACWRDLRRLWRRTMSRRALGVLGITFLWAGLLLLVIRNYGGDGWWGDWFEHYQRSVFFVEHWPLDFKFLNHYGLSDRPPFMNLICAHYVAERGDTFVAYQWIATFLNALPVLACCLFTTSVGLRERVARRSVWAVLAVVLIASPIYVQNMTFVWTKSFAGFFAMLGLWFYVRGWMKADGKRMIAGFLFASAGCVAHPYVAASLAAMAGHYIFAVWAGRPRRWREAGQIFILCAVLPVCWWGWAAWEYGATAASGNHLFEPYLEARDVGVLGRIGFNTVSTFVPYFLRSPPYMFLEQKDRAGLVRDLAFNLYQVNAIFALGSTGAAMLVYAIWSGALGWRAWPRRLRRFWLVFLVSSIGLGLCIVPQPENWGAAHLCMLPQVFVGLAVAAGVMGALPLGWKRIIIIGLTIDFVLGVLLQVQMERRTFEVVRDSATGTVRVVDATLSHAAISNVVLKHEASVYFIGDRVAGAGAIIELAIGAMFVIPMVRMALTVGLWGRRGGVGIEMASRGDRSCR
jgi:hypothetical protein